MPVVSASPFDCLIKTDQLRFFTFKMNYEVYTPGVYAAFDMYRHTGTTHHTIIY